MSWNTYRNLESSLKDFLEASATNDSLVDLAGNSINFRVGRKEDDKWELNTISCYSDSKDLPRLEIGSNKRNTRYLIVIDVFAKNEVDRSELADWLETTINDGWRYYTYTGNVNSPDNPTRVAGGWVSFDFLTDTRVELGQTIADFDSHRHQITINAWISL